MDSSLHGVPNPFSSDQITLRPIGIDDRSEIVFKDGKRYDNLVMDQL